MNEGQRRQRQAQDKVRKKYTAQYATKVVIFFIRLRLSFAMRRLFYGLMYKLQNKLWRHIFN